VKIDPDHRRPATSKRFDSEPVVEPYPGWVRVLIWIACAAFSLAGWWGVFLVAKVLLRLAGR
jgi:hypothetical protein